MFWSSLILFNAVDIGEYFRKEKIAACSARSHRPPRKDPKVEAVVGYAIAQNTIIQSSGNPSHS